GGAASGDALDPAEPETGRGQVGEVLAQELSGQDRHLAKVVQRLDPLRRDLVLVEAPAVGARVTIGEFEMTAQLGELRVAKRRRVHPLGAVEALEPRER